MYTKKSLDKYDYICIDVETKGLKWWLDEEGIFGIALTTCEGESIYVDIRENPRFVDWLMIQKPKKIVNHNIKFDLHMLWGIGVYFDPEICECTEVRACLIDGDRFSYSLDSLAKDYLSSEKESDLHTLVQVGVFFDLEICKYIEVRLCILDILTKDYLGSGKESGIYEDLAKEFGGIASRNVQIKNLHRAASSLVSGYAKKDTRLAMALWEFQEVEIKKQGLERIWKLEKELFPVIFDMETRGMRIDIDKSNKAVVEITSKIDNLQKKLNDVSGFELNINSNKHLEKVFEPYNKDGEWFTKYGDRLAATKKGKPSFSKESIKDHKGDFTTMLLDLRKSLKTRDTFLKGHVLGYVHEGYVHPTIRQTKSDEGGAATGRLSVSEPAMQQIPARDKETAKMLRPIFIPDQGHIWACWDYSQFEYRMFSHYVDDDRIKDIYLKDPNFDYHQMVADLTGLPRNAPETGGANAKQLNLSMIYDMGSASIARTLGLPLDPKTYEFKDEEGKTVKYSKGGPEAMEIIEKYHAAIPGVRKLGQSVKNVAIRRKFIRSIAGRKMRYETKKNIHKAKAWLCQGSSADCMKQKMIEVFNYFKNEEPECRIYMAVHDELNVGIPTNAPNFNEIIKKVTDILECYDGINSPIKINIPITTDYGQGKNWAEASGKGA